MFTPDYMLGRLVVRVVTDATQYHTTMRGLHGPIGQFISSVTALGRTLTTTLSLPLAAIAATSVRAFARFDDAMTRSLAVMGNTASSMRRDFDSIIDGANRTAGAFPMAGTSPVRQQMEETAFGISRRSITSPRELAQAYYYLGTAGYDASRAMSVLPDVERFAVAGMMDMNKATELLIGAQNALGLASQDEVVNLRNLTRVMDTLTAGGIMALGTVEELSEALTNRSAAAMRSTGIEIEEGVAILAAYAEQNIRGRLAGNQLAIMLRELQVAAITSSEAWQRNRVAVFSIDGSMKPIADIVRQLELRMEGMSAIERRVFLMQLGLTQRSIGALMPLIGKSEAIRGYQAALENVEGTTRRIAEFQLTSFTNQMKILWNNITEVGIGIGQNLAPWIGKLNILIMDGISWWQKLNPAVRQGITLLGAITIVAGPLLLIFSNLVHILPRLVGMMSGLFFPIIGTMLLVTLVTRGFELSWENLDRVMKSGKEMWNSIPDYVRHFAAQVLLAVLAIKSLSSAVTLFISLTGLRTIWAIIASGIGVVIFAIRGLIGALFALRAAAVPYAMLIGRGPLLALGMIATAAIGVYMAFDSIGDAIKGVIDWYQKLKPATQSVVLFFAAITAGYVGLIAAFSIAGSIASILTFFKTLAVVAVSLGGTIISLTGLFSLIPATLVGIVALIVYLNRQAIFDPLIDGIRNIGNTFNQVWNGIKDALAANNLRLAMEIVSVGIQLVWQQMIQAMERAWDGLFESLERSFVGWWTTLGRAIVQVYDVLRGTDNVRVTDAAIRRVQEARNPALQRGRERLIATDAIRNEIEANIRLGIPFEGLMEGTRGRLEVQARLGNDVILRVVQQMYEAHREAYRNTAIEDITPRMTAAAGGTPVPGWFSELRRIAERASMIQEQGPRAANIADLQQRLTDLTAVASRQAEFGRLGLRQQDLQVRAILGMAGGGGLGPLGALGVIAGLELPAVNTRRGLTPSDVELEDEISQRPPPGRFQQIELRRFLLEGPGGLAAAPPRRQSVSDEETHRLLGRLIPNEGRNQPAPGTRPVTRR